ncbi:MAG: Hsp33 family molecular chaperone HslO, partial [Bacteriovoracia bacterium]
MAKKPAQRKAKTPAKKKAGGKKPAKPKTQQKSAPRKSAAKSREAHWVKCISTEGNFRGVAIHAKDLVQEIVDMHGLEGIAAKGLGEAVLGALFIASNCKEGEKINLNIQGSGHYRQVLVDAYPEGIVRGYVIEREDPESTAGPSRGPWGEGSLSVLRTKSLEREQPYIGTVPLVTGHLAKDLTYYWLQSEQIPSAVGIVVDVEKKKVKTAAGFIVQVLPNASPQEVSALQSKMEHFPSLAKELGKNSDP